jgi:ferredoxin/flavodoxin
MDNILILYHSAAGSTRLVARLIEAALQGCAQTRLLSIEAPEILALVADYDHLVFGFPTYHCDPSASIRAFIERLPVFTSPKKVFSFTTCGLYSANTLRIFAKHCLTKNLITVHSRSYRSPASDGSLLAPWLPFVYRFEKNLVEKVKADVDTVLAAFADNDSKLAISRFRLYSILNYPNKLGGQIVKFPIYTFAERCTQCGVCVQDCPHDCFEIDALGIPHHRMDGCEHCYRCIHTCPTQALTLRRNQVVTRQLNKQFFAAKWEAL